MNKSKKRTRTKSFPPSDITWAAVEFEREPHPFTYQFTLFFLGGFLFCTLVFSYYTKIPITVVGTGKITSLKPPVPIRSATKMTVSVLHIAENQKVVKGQVLLSSVENLTQADRNNLKEYQDDIKWVMAQNLKECAKCEGLLNAANDVYVKIRAQGDLLTVISPIQDHVREMIVALAERDQLPSLIASSRLKIKLDENKLKSIKANNAGSILLKEVEDLQTDIAENRAKIEEKYVASNDRIKNAKIHIISGMSALSNQVRYLGEQFSIYAPFSGTITSLNVKGSGEVLQVGQVLMSLVPLDSPLVAELQIDNRDLSDTQLGLPAEISIDSLPEYDYGTVKGKVIEITRKELDPEAQERSLASLSTNAVPVFLARISLDKQALKKDGIESRFIVGMTLKGFVQVRDDSILRIIARSLFQIKEDFAASHR